MPDNINTPFTEQLTKVRCEFSKQSKHWATDKKRFSVAEWIVEILKPASHHEVLDVAAGTGRLSRTIAPHVKHIVALDFTPEMIEVGEAETRHLENLTFKQGQAEALPFPDGSFDLVVSRYQQDHLCLDCEAYASSGNKYFSVHHIWPEHP